MTDFNNIKLKEEVILVIGQMGSDAGYTVLTPHGVKHVPGNNPEAQRAFEELKVAQARLAEIAEKELPRSAEGGGGFAQG